MTKRRARVARQVPTRALERWIVRRDEHGVCVLIASAIAHDSCFNVKTDHKTEVLLGRTEVQPYCSREPEACSLKSDVLSTFQRNLEQLRPQLACHK
jgi:hypothetical protein